VDIHVHFRDPGLTHKEDWATGSAAAAAGGVTTVFDMPNTNPPTGTLEAYAMKREAARSKSIVNFGIYGLLGTDNLHVLELLAEAGVAGFKLFMGDTTGHLPCPDDGTILEGFEIIAALGLRTTVHAENTPILRHRERRIREAGRTDLLAHLDSRPDVCVLEAVNRTAIFAEWTGARVHIAHESTRLTLPFLRFFKERGVDLTAETCPQYLVLSTDDMHGLNGSVLKVNPPIRGPENKDALLDALAGGLIDILSTDHAPHLPEEKRGNEVWAVASGLTGVETSMRLMLTFVNEGRITLEDYVRMASAGPARAFGLYPRKGVLQPGADADIVLVDIGRRDVIRAERLHSRGKVTPYEGRETVGLPVMTLVNGTVVMRDGEVIGQPGTGRQVRPEMPPACPRNRDQTTAAILQARESATAS
ncbi:MAG: dihydroorotase family protein, partial [Pseudomonadota bacterium]|nr:dihydroorotase family protein [Pseudomonadota bacterium]